MSVLIDHLATNKRQTAALILAAMAVAGVILFVTFIAPRSEPGNQLILGLSASRVVIGAVFLALLLANTAAVLFAIKDLTPRQKDFEKKLVGTFSAHLRPMLLVLYASVLLTGAFLLLAIPPVIRPLSFLEPASARLGSFIGWIFVASLLLVVMLRILAAETLRNDPAVTRLDEAAALIGLFLAVFVLYAHFAALIGWINKTKYSFWDLLAGQFIQGKLYLKNPPYTHDLTLYNGKWYVPMPPLPAILLMPLAYLIGAENISTSYISMVFSALNGVLLYLILKELDRRKWIDISTTGIIILVTLFLFGTPHLWLGISGRGWYFSQILTALFLALATYAALRMWPAWLAGVFIAVAMMARPNALMTWPFIFAIAMQALKENGGKMDLQRALRWGAETVPPIALAIAGLLVYNYLRFDDFLDFGYTTVNAGADILYRVQTWGIFSPHFIPTNLMVMLFRLPRLDPGGRWPIEPSTTGMSIFLTTPALIYLFHRYPKQWWVTGAWLAVLCNVALLSLYHNTGAHQFGYRYIVDFIVPLFTLLAVALGRKIPWHFVLLVLASIAINLYGADWFMNG